MKRFAILLVVIGIAMLPLTSATVSHGARTNATTLPEYFQYSGYSGGGSSRGGLPALSDEPFDNIALTFRVAKDWYYNKTVTYALRDVVPEVMVIPNGESEDVSLTLNVLKNKSYNVAKPNDAVYKYFNLYFGSKRYSSAFIKFKALKSWSNGNPVTLQNWNGKTWVALTTELVSSDNEYSYYRSQVIGTNYPRFVIVGKQKGASLDAVVIGKPMPPTAQEQSTSMVTVTTTGTAVPAKTTTTANPFQLNPWVVVIGVTMLIILGIVYFNIA